MKKILLLITVLMAVIACSSETNEVVPAGTILQSPSEGLEAILSVGDLTKLTDLVVKAEVISSTYTEDMITPPNAKIEGLLYTNKFFLTEIKIESFLKGSSPDTITVVTSAGLIDDPNSKTPVLTPGQEYVLFLTATEKDDYWEGNYLTSFQGRWHILPDLPNKVVQESSLKAVDVDDLIADIR